MAELLARRFPRAVHVRGDVFRRFIVSGREEPSPVMTWAAREQLLLRYRLAAAVADGYAQAGFLVVLQDVIIGPVLGEVVAMLQTRPRHVVVLDPAAATVRAREAARAKTGCAEGWDAASLVETLRGTTARIGLRLGTTDQTPEATVAAVLNQLHHAAQATSPG